MTVDQLQNLDTQSPGKASDVGLDVSTAISGCLVDLYVGMPPEEKAYREEAEQLDIKNNATRKVTSIKRKLWAGVAEIEEMQRVRGVARNHAIRDLGVVAGKGSKVPYFVLFEDLPKLTKIVSECHNIFKQQAKILDDPDVYENRLGICKVVMGDKYDRNNYPATVKDCMDRICWQFSVTPTGQMDMSGTLGTMLSNVEESCREYIEYHASETASRFSSTIKDSVKAELDERKSDSLKYYLENIRSRLDARNYTDEAKDSGKKVSDSPISETLLPNALDKATKLKKYAKVLGDSTTESICSKTITALSDVPTSALKDSKYTRDSIISNVNDILGKF